MKINRKTFRQKLENWYLQNHRELPWRETKDPYKIWLSEIILQQTRVNQGLPYYLKFVAQYPSIHDLANATEVEVLRLWQGLGYYSRARNLHACAKEVVANHNGTFPKDYDQLLKLKGIGEYTAAAIASISFKIPKPVLDGNVFRVISRLFGVYEDIAETKSKKSFYRILEDLIPKNSPDLFNQAMMEFGALHCIPVNPGCTSCIFAGDCHGFISGEQSNLPVKSKKVKVRHRMFHYFLFVHDHKLFMKQRGASDIWEGLFDFYLEETPKESNFTPDSLFSKDQLTESTLIEKSVPYKHILTHQRIIANFYVVQLRRKTPFEDILKDMAGFNANEILNLPKPKLIDRYLKEQFFSLDLI